MAKNSSPTITDETPNTSSRGKPLIDPERDRLLPLTTAAARHPLMRDPLSKKPTHPSTMVRRHVDGIRLPDGRRVKLEAIRLSGGMYTTDRAIRAFIRALNPPEKPSPEEADEELAAAGIRD